MTSSISCSRNSISHSHSSVLRKQWPGIPGRPVFGDLGSHRPQLRPGLLIFLLALRLALRQHLLKLLLLLVIQHGLNLRI
jgi:hypothetical protein